MTKSELLSKVWISRTTRLPPDDREIIVIGWNRVTDRPMIFSGEVLRYAMDCLNNKIKPDKTKTAWELEACNPFNCDYWYIPVKPSKE